LGYVWVNLARCPYSDHAAIPKKWQSKPQRLSMSLSRRFQEIPASSVPIRPVVINLYLYSTVLGHNTKIRRKFKQYKIAASPPSNSRRGKSWRRWRHSQWASDHN
jgi:hypothetical protein